MAKGKPRLDKYERLISRLYEALIVLFLEQKVQGLHIVSSHGDASLTASRRRLTKNLAFIYDSNKGGETTTSIAVQDCETCFRFWVATNLKHDHIAGQPSPKGVEFLRTILLRLKNSSSLSELQRKEEEDLLAQTCASFARSRLKKEGRILSNAVKACFDHLDDVNFVRGNLTRAGKSHGEWGNLYILLTWT